MKIHQVEWFVFVTVGEAPAIQETYRFWLEKGAAPQHYYAKKLGARHRVISHGLTGEERHVDLEEVEVESADNWRLHSQRPSATVPANKHLN